jgi:hypothetical protein
MNKTEQSISGYEPVDRNYPIEKAFEIRYSSLNAEQVTEIQNKFQEILLQIINTPGINVNYYRNSSY